MSKIEQFSPLASLVSVYHLMVRAGQIARCHYKYKMTGWGIMFICAMVLQCAESVPVTVYLTTDVVYNDKCLRNDITPVHFVKANILLIC